jgi:class 3 adenylate cyclase
MYYLSLATNHMFRLTAILLTIVCVTSVYGAEPTHLLNRQYKDQFLWLDSLRNSSYPLDSATFMSTFDKLETWADNEGDRQFSQTTRLMKYRWLKDRGLNMAALDKMFSDLLSSVKGTKYAELTADVLFQYADYLWLKRSYSRSLENYIHAYNIAISLKGETYPSIGELIYSLGGRFYYFRDFATASKYFSSYWRLVPQQYRNTETSKLNTLALSFTNQGVYDSALHYYNMAETFALRDNDKFWMALIGGNKAYSYYMQGKYDEAIPLFEKEINTNIGTIEAANSMFNLGAIYLAKGEKERAFKLQKGAYEILKNGGYANNFHIVKNSYPVMAATYAAMGDHVMAYRFLDSARLAMDTVNRQRNMLYISGVQHKIEADNYLQDLHRKEAELAFQRSQRNWLLAGVAALVVFLLIILRQKKRISIEKKRSDDLLLNILPFETAEELKRTGAAKAKNYEMVTVLFTDFEDFTEASEHLSAEELVGEINYCYSEFDKILSRYGVEKIKTIGDSYMCAGGLPRECKTHAEDVVAVAIEIVKFMEKEKARRESLGRKFFEMRIGIHTGPVVAGIVGIKKFAYDIWGDTVNIASRMESSGQPGRINISETTYERVKDRFACIYRGEVNAKNKGKMKMYFVEPVIPEHIHQPLSVEVDLSI